MRRRQHFGAAILAFIGLTTLVFGCASQPDIQQPESQASDGRLAAIQSVSTMEIEEAVQVEIKADGPLTFSALKQPDPPAVVLYFPQTSVDLLPPVQDVGKGTLTNIAVRNGNGNQTARMEIGLLKDTAYSARQDGSKIVLMFAKPRSTPQETTVRSQAAGPDNSPSVEAALQTSSANPSTPVGNSTPPPGSPPIPASVPDGSNWVNKVDFFSEPNGKSTLIVGTTQTADYQIQKPSPQRIEVRLRNTRVPSYQQRPLITTRFSSAVNRIMPLQPDKTRDESIIAIDLREAVPFNAEQTGNVLMIHFEASSIPPKPMEQADLPAWKQALASNDIETLPAAQVPSAAGPQTMGKAMGSAALTRPAQEELELKNYLEGRPKTYTGEKIALDFYETDVKNVFRILREISGKNFAIDKNVTGKVTMTLDKPVPWDQVLDLVLRMNQLGMAHEGNIIRIATLETLKQEDALRKAKLEALKKAREEVKALEPLITRYIPVSYSNANSEVKPHIEQILTKDRGIVSVDGKNNQIIITDTAEVVKQAEEIIRRIDKVTSQVIIEARVVEVSNNFSRELGITWGAEVGPGTIPGTGWATAGDVAMNFPTASPSSIGINFSRLSGVPFVLNARLDALETTGEGRILSSPKILTLDNKTAKIKQGVEYPYLERDSAGGSSTKFKNIDLLLEVTPHVTPDDRISLTIFITKNDVASITLEGTPAVATNEAQTELLVNDGDTVVIGGIIKATENSGESGWPGLRKLPVVGYLFKNEQKKSQSNELLIFITPRILQLEQAAAQIN